MNEEKQATCEYCGQFLYAERSTKTYCSNSCRQLAYLERRSRKMAQATYIEETDFENVANSIPEPKNESPDTIQAIEVENLPEETNTNPAGMQYSHNRRKRISRSQTHANKLNIIDGRLVLLGAAAAGLLVYNMFDSAKRTK